MEIVDPVAHSTKEMMAKCYLLSLLAPSSSSERTFTTTRMG